MQLERETPRVKELMIVNGKRKGGGKARSKRKTTQQTARRRSAPRRVAAPGPARRGRRRRRNPSADVGGALKVAGFAAGLALVMQPISHVASRKIQNRPVRALVRVGAPLALGAGLGVFVKSKHPSLGSAMVAVGTGLAMLHGLSEIASGGAAPVGVLQKAGFGQLGAPDDLVMRDGQVFRIGDDGSQTLLFGAEATPIMLQLEDGSQEQGTYLGALGEGTALIMRADGTMEQLATDDGTSQVSGLETAENLSGLGGLETAENLSGTEGEDEGNEG